MKSLELNEMENLQGGSCETSTASVVLASASAIYAITMATGPIGWLFVGVALVGTSLAHYNLYINDDCMSSK